MDLLDAIRRIRALRLELARRDPRRGMPVAPPEGAAEEAIACAERRMGMRLPPSYRALLSMHDGWPQIFAGAGLLGSRPLTRGAYLGVAQMMLEENEGAARGRGAARAREATRARQGEAGAQRTWFDGPGPDRARGRMRAAGLVPFGIDPDAETLFAWDPETARDDGEMDVVVWMSGLGMRLSSFPELLELVADMLEAELELPVEEAMSVSTSVTPAPPSVTPAPTSGVREVTPGGSRARAGSVMPPPPSMRPAARPVARIALFG
ncbi:SMI1/KNR4 family protein [Chondromyces crocatus]|uniref:Knr4/Smi1-like domain-containing protein n=1 Tax=Chondromyces crocatus TaxID=52 RepID=A0A0K1ELM6_CHOCO|nr:SMI1/KNR4 family protein [Chondromyces crocatus]AKT41716.1 uncharacterized protein CMC5_059270 [Chondromyces crocatus]